MGRTPCCLKVGLNRGPWTPEEDLCLASYIEAHGEGGWRTLPKKAGLLRCGKSCRLRWMNYLRPDVKHGHILPEEEDLILRLHRLLGNRWSLIAGRMPGRTDNEVKNYWNTHLSKKLISQGIDPRTHKPLSESEDICSSPGNSELSHKSQKENNAEIPRNVADGTADFQDAVASKGGAIAEDQTSGKSPANQLLESSPSQPASVAVDFVSQPPSISSTPHSFQQSITSTCVPGGVSDSVDINHNKGCKQISFPLLNTACFNSSAQEEVARDYLDQYLMKNPVTNSNDMITSTVRLSSALQNAPFVGQFDANHAFMSGNALLNEKRQMSQSAQALEMEPHPSLVHPSEEGTYNKLSHTTCAVSDQITAFNYQYLISPTATGAALVDFNSDIFPSFVEPFINEELQLQEPSVQTSIAQNIELCPSSQPKAVNLSNYDLWSMLSPSSQYRP